MKNSVYYNVMFLLMILAGRVQADPLGSQLSKALDELDRYDELVASPIPSLSIRRLSLTGCRSLLSMSSRARKLLRCVSPARYRP